MKITGNRRFGYGRFFCVLCVLLSAVILLAAPVSARDAETASGTLHVTAEVSTKNSEIVVTVKPDSAFLKANKDETLHLFALQPYESEASLSSKAPIASERLKSETVFRIPDEENLRYARFLAAVGQDSGYAVLVSDVYISNPDVYAGNTAQRDEAASVKGITVSQGMLGEAERLGVSYAVIPIVLDHYLIYDYSEYSEKIGDITTFFDPGRIAALDHETETLRQAGVHVLFRFLLDGTARATAMPAADLYAPAANPEASLWGICSGTEAGYARTRAVFQFFAERYASDSKGCAPDFILGYQVSENAEWNNYGTVSAKTAVKMYASSFRIADTALRAVSANSRVYIPLSNILPALEQCLSDFAREMDGGAWSVAVSPYASDPLSDAVWEDERASDASDSPYLTMKNLPLLKTLLTQKQFQYQNRLRAVIIDDYAVQGNTGDPDSAERQAASLAYAYYRAANAGFIDAFIWHRVYDCADEGASYGLCDPAGKEKAAYRVFQTIDTQLGSAVTESFPELMGAKNWSAVFKGCNPKKAETVKRFESEPEDTTFAENANPKVVIDFTDRFLHGFVPTEQASSVTAAPIAASGTEINGTVLQVNAYPSSDGDCAGATLTFTDGGKLLSGAQYLFVTVKAEPSGSEETVPFTIRMGKTGGNSTKLFSGETVLHAGRWTTVAFDVGDYLRSADGTDYLKLTAACGTLGGTFSVNAVSVQNGGGGNLFSGILRAVLCILLILVLIFVVLVIRARIIRKRKRRRRQQQLAARRAAMERAGQQTAQRTVPSPNAVPARQPQPNPVSSTSANTVPRHRTAKRMPDPVKTENSADRNGENRKD